MTLAKSAVQNGTISVEKYMEIRKALGGKKAKDGSTDAARDGDLSVKAVGGKKAKAMAISKAMDGKKAKDGSTGAAQDGDLSVEEAMEIFKAMAGKKAKDGSMGAARDGDLSVKEAMEICKAMGGEETTDDAALDGDLSVKEAMETDDAARDGDLSLNEAREICKAMGGFKVVVGARPKVADSAWDVSVKHTTGQKWSKQSWSRKQIGDGSLRACVLHAIELMVKMYENEQEGHRAHVEQEEATHVEPEEATENEEQPDCRHDGDQDKTDEESQEPQQKRRCTENKADASDAVRDLSTAFHQEP